MIIISQTVFAWKGIETEWRREELKIRRKYPEESVDTFESVWKGDYSRATFPYCKSVNITKHTNTDLAEHLVLFKLFFSKNIF